MKRIKLPKDVWLSLYKSLHDTIGHATRIKALNNDDVRDEVLDSDIVICRAFKKLDQIIQVSREIAKKPHKLIVLKGQNAQEDLKKAFNKEKYDYKLENSITNEDSKIIIVDFKK